MINEILESIAAEPSKTGKLAIIQSHKDNDLLKRVFQTALNRESLFGMKVIPDYYKNAFSPYTLEIGLNKISQISDKKVTGALAKDLLIQVLEDLNQGDAEVIKKVVLKDLRIGVSGKTLNKVYGKNFIIDTPYQGASSYDPLLVMKVFDDSDGASSQIKKDGRYANLIHRGGGITPRIESRQGFENKLYGAKFLDEVEGFNPCVLHGELTISYDGVNDIERKISNGIINSLVSIGEKIDDGEDVSKDEEKFFKKHGRSTQEMLNCIIYTVWDRITLDEYYEAVSHVPYEARMTNVVSEMYDNKTESIRLIESRRVFSLDEAQQHFREALHEGEEGTVLKSLTAGWKNGKPNYQVKLKLEIRTEMKIVGFIQGKGKNSHLISSLMTESGCGLVKSDPCGMSVEDMEYVTANQDMLMGAIVEVKSCGLSTDKDGNHSLQHPVFIEIRDDKLFADSLEDIMRIEEAAKSLEQ